MKHLILRGLSVLLVSAASTTAVGAEIPVVAQNTNTSISSTSQLEPFNLVSMAYQGYFTAQGIPSNSSFIYAYRVRHIGPQELVKSAIAQNRLPAEALSDLRYLRAVEWELRTFDRI